jgi:hypothetical protein
VHTVTKVLVVFASILCVLLAALTMAYSVNVDRIVADRRSEIDRRITAETLANNRVAQGAEEAARLSQMVQAKDSQISQLNTKIAALEAERAQLNQNLAAAVAGRDSIVGQIDQAVATSKTQALLIQQYRDEVTKLRENELMYKKHEIELGDRINDLESSNEVKDQSVRALQEQLVEARRAIDAAGGAIALGPSRGPTQPYKPSIAISGKVTNTKKDAATGKPMARINVGSNNQVREHMQLAIVRGNQFLGNLVVTKTDLGWAEGVIDYVGNTKVEVKDGDEVTSLVSR